MRLPWKQPQLRASLTTDVLDAGQALRAGDVVGSVAETAAAEIAGGLYAAAFSGARIVPESLAGAITPELAASMARAMVCRGEWLAVIEVDAAGLRLVEASDWTPGGSGTTTSSWSYKCELPTPAGDVTVFRPGSEIVHLRYSYSPQTPWKGRSAFQAAASTSRLVGGLEYRLADELSAEVGNLVPMPDVELATDTLAKNFRALRGKTGFVRSTKAGFGEGQALAPPSDWVARRIGANPPATLQGLRADGLLSMLAAVGIPPAIAIAVGDGAGQRESWRRFVHGGVHGLARLMSTELSMKLGTAVSWDFTALQASDLSGRSRSFKQMVEAGMDLERAARNAALS